MLVAAGTTNFEEMMSTKRGVKAAITWFIQQGILEQFKIAREMEEGRSDKGRGSRA